MIRVALLLLLDGAIYLAGCKADVGEASLGPDAGSPSIPLPDSAPVVVADAAPLGPDAGPVECPSSVPASFGDLGPQLINKNDLGGRYNVFIDINRNEDHFFVINAYSGRGVFADGMLEGTYDLVADDNDFQYCAACIMMFASYGDGPESVHMMAQKGTLVVDSVVGAEISGSLEDVLLSAIKIVYDDEGVSCGDIEDPICVNTICLSGRCGRQVPLEGCETSLGSLAF